MTTTEQQLLDILSSIQGSGYFVATGVRELVLPGLEIAGLGEIGLPLNAIQAKAMIDVARRAPFGKGSRTITDTTVRSAWEIDADQLGFRNAGWAPFIQSVVDELKVGLGLEAKKVKALRLIPNLTSAP